MNPRPRPVLSDMPLDVVEDILAYTGASTRCALRRCSKSFRRVVDSTPATYKSIQLKFGTDLTEMRVRDGEKEMVAEYRAASNGCLVNGQMIDGEEHCEKAIRDFTRLVGNSKTRINRLRFDDLPGAGRLLKLVSGVSRHHLRAKKLACNVQLKPEQLVDLFSLLHPGTCQSISISLPKGSDLEKVMEMEVWKEAKEVEVDCLRMKYSSENMAHFERIHLKKLLFSVEVFKLALENAKRQGDRFREVRFEGTRFDREEPATLFEYISQKCDSMGVAADGRKYAEFKIPGTDEHSIRVSIAPFRTPNITMYLHQH